MTQVLRWPTFLVAILATFWIAGTLPSQEAKKKEEPSDPFKGLKYRSIGPAAGGRTTRSCGVPGDPNIYYVGAASGGVWKTTDAGISWKPIFDDQPTSSIGAVAVAPSDPNVIYVGSGEANIRGNVAPGNGIYVSTDAGKSWKHVWKQVGQIAHIVVHPKNADIAFAAVLGSAFRHDGPLQAEVNNPERGVYRTMDGGKTWKQVLARKVRDRAIHLKKKEGGDEFQPVWEHIGAIDICIDPNNPRILFAALFQTHRTPWSFTSGGPGSGLYRSDNGGDTWKEIEPAPSPPAPLPEGEGSGLPARPYGRIGVAVAPSNSQRIYALIEAENGGLYRSDDGGEKWHLVNGARYLRQRPWYFSTVHVDPKNPDVVYCPSVRLLKSIDGGKSFKQMKGVHHPDHHDLWIDPLNPKRMIDSNDGGVDITTNGGQTWHMPMLPICQFYHISVDNSVPYRVMGNMQDQGTASGPSNSLSSQGISLSDWHTVGGGETGYTVADPDDPNIVYSGEYAGILTIYDHRTRQSRNISIYPTNPSGKGAEDLRYRFQWTAPLLISPHREAREEGRGVRNLYHAANVLFRSQDQGKTWAKISPDLTRNDNAKQKWSGGPITGDNTGVEYYGTIFAIAESPVEAGVLWAGSDDGLVHVSRDGGKKWTNVTKNIPGLKEWATVCCIEASSHMPSVAYVVVDAHRLDDNTPYLYVTTDFGKTWFDITSNLPKTDYLRVVREDPKQFGLLYVGSETQVHVSREAGKHWESLKLNMPTVAISDLQVKHNDLVVGTSGRSIWILDDVTPIRTWRAAAQKDPVAGPSFLAPPPATRWRYSGDNYVGDDRIPGENPAKGALLTYYLPEKAKNDLTLEIFDEKNALVQKLSSKKSDIVIDEEAPDVPWSIFKPTVLPKEKGYNRVAWNLEMLGPKIIPGAKNDGGVPYRGPMVFPGTYTLKLHVDGKVLTQTVEVKLDPRSKATRGELEEAQKLALQLRGDITKLSETVIALQSVRAQIQARVKAVDGDAKAEGWVKQTRAVIAKLHALEEELHNPKAEVTYDILAKKGGAKLYSQLGPLYDTVRDIEGPVSQGMREVHAENAKELARLEAIWRAYLAGEIAALNEQARTLGQPAIIAPK
ncbi:MAG: glycosyl hydrolase [Planctomycetes bacterium]|nr:glycosyl hydrolase [Planctomycetota bacterium]